MKIKDLPDDMRPDERALAFGVEALSESELLAVIIRTGTAGKSSIELAEEILSAKRGKYGLINLLNSSYSDFITHKGLGAVKSLQLACICELSKRISRVSVLESAKAVDSAFAASYYMEELRHLEYEVIYLILTDIKGCFKKSMMLSKGSSVAAVTGIREILKAALKEDAYGIFMVHNHPSGDPAPSMQDIRFSAALKDAAGSVGISFRDSLIIGNGTYTSLSQKGLI